MKYSSGAVALAVVMCGGLLAAGCARTPAPDTVAMVNGTPVTAAEFRSRYERYLSSTSLRDNIQVRKQVLENMINERLIFRDLEASEAATDPALVAELERIRQQALADGYARRMTTDTMRVSMAQMGEEFRRFNTKLTARYVYARTKEGALALRARLKAGATFDQIAREVFEDPGLATNGGSLGTFGWSEMEEALEDTAYTLKPGELSMPVRLSMGYAIVRVDSRVNVNPLASESDYAKVAGKLGDAIIKRNAPHVLRKHVQSLTDAMHPEFDERGITAMLAAWPEGTGEDTSSAKPDENRPLPPDLRGARIVRLNDVWWTADTLMERLGAVKQRQKRRVHDAGDLKDMVLALAARPVIVARASAMHLERDSLVAMQIETMSGECRLRSWARLVQDTVGKAGFPDTLLQRVYRENTATFSDPPMVNVAEVLVRTEGEARRIADVARRGADFAGLARKHSIRLWAAKRGGELGYNTVAGFGVMGEKLFAAPPGTIVGPDLVDPYWGVFKVLARRQGKLHTFDESREHLLTQTRSMKQKDAFLAAVARLRASATIQMFVETLANVPVQSVNH
jgi:parvulin-like peptidyl-prolyl isomerase